MSIHRFTAAVLITFGSVTGCASAPKLPVFGTWRVGSYTPPGSSVRSPVQALAWIGVSASFAADDARFGGDRCSAPKYTQRTLSGAEFQQEYHVPVTALGITSDPVTVYRLECAYDWGGQTKTLIVKSPTSLLTPWDGTFFELVKSPAAFK